MLLGRNQRSLLLVYHCFGVANEFTESTEDLIKPLVERADPFLVTLSLTDRASAGWNVEKDGGVGRAA